MEGAKILSISELLQRTRPLTATASLESSSPSKRKIQTPPSHKPQPQNPSPAFANPNPKTLEPLCYAAIIIGTVRLSDHSNPTIQNSCHLKNHCLSFSDGLSTICCTFLDLEDLSIIGKQIRVLSWNFIPFKSSGGLLEIIRWEFAESTFGTNPLGDRSPWIPLGSEATSSMEENLSARSRIRGRLEAVSPVFVIPCTVQSGSFGAECGRGFTDSSRNMAGFLVDISVCKRSACRAEVLEAIREQICHSSTKQVFIYFCGAALNCRHLLSKLLGRVVSITGLKKKSIVVGREESHTMFVTTDKTALHLSKTPLAFMPKSRVMVSGRCESGGYRGIVTGVYFQGLVVELDEKVCLLLTDQILVPPHSLRIGALVSLSHIHFIHPNFSWAKMLLLGACFKTNINVEGFSPLETQCYFRSQTQSLLGKFIESLMFSARLWALLTVSCFKKKFAGVFSEKEILGSSHKEGLAQKYARSSLPICVFQLRHGLFTEFCKHDSVGFDNNPNFVPPKLAVPMSNFICECEAIWATLLFKMRKDTETIGLNHHASLLSCEGKSYSRMLRRILSSEDLGIVLVGTIKICSTSGRLQLVDATGSVDVVIPDLLSNGDIDKLYEVKDYKLILEGLPVRIDPLRLPKSDSFSCRSIFQRFMPKRELNHLKIYIHFYLRNATCLNVSLSLPLPSSRDKQDDFKAISGGIYHLLLVTHKLPATQNFHGDPNILNRARLFAEAIILPYNLFLAGGNGDSQPLKFSRGNLKAPLHYAEMKDCTGKLWFKRQKTGSRISLEVVGEGAYGLQSKRPSNLCSRSELPCFVAVRSNNDEGLLVPGIWFCLNSNVVDKPSAQKVLLEFRSDCFDMYQGLELANIRSHYFSWSTSLPFCHPLHDCIASCCTPQTGVFFKLLHIGMYYTMKCANEEPLCSLKDHNEYTNYGKVLVTSQAPIWSLSFMSMEVLQQSNPTQECSLVAPSPGNNEHAFGNFLHDDLLFHRSLNPISDVNQCVLMKVTCFLKEGSEALEDGLRPIAMPSKAVSVSKCIQTMMEAPHQPFEPSVLKMSLTEGNLISLFGIVMDVHGYYCAADTKVHLNGKSICNINPRAMQEVLNSVCIHVFDDHHMVRIRGIVAKHAYPIGLGPGVHATFYRVLITGTSSRQCHLSLTPESFIVINSVKEVDHQFDERYSMPMLYSEIVDENLFNLVPSGLISQLMIGSLGLTSIRFRCRVAAVHILLLGSHTFKFEKPISDEQSRNPTVNIPLAGFILDDGSSLCCCWADAERAEMLLRIHDTEAGSFSNSSKSLNTMGSSKTQSTARYHLEKMLKKHQKITVKNLGAMLDSSCLDFTFARNSNEMFSSSDESLLKFIFLNACHGSVLNVVGSVMDSNAIRWLERELAALQVSVHSMLNLWASDVCYVDPVAEARKMVQELTNR